MFKGFPEPKRAPVSHITPVSPTEESKAFNTQRSRQELVMALLETQRNMKDTDSGIDIHSQPVEKLGLTLPLIESLRLWHIDFIRDITRCTEREFYLQAKISREDITEIHQALIARGVDFQSPGESDPLDQYIGTIFSDVTTRILNSLQQVGVYSLRDLAGKTKRDLLMSESIGKKTVYDLEKILTQYNLTWKNE